MACPTVQTGAAFLSSVLSYVDCQAQDLGSLGYQSLSASDSVAGALLTGLLTVFIALYGYRLIFGHGSNGRDVVSGAIAVGVALTLATSWVAYRTVIYNAVLYGPAEVAGAITRVGGLAGSQYRLVDRLQGIDNGILQLTVVGTGRKPQGSDTKKEGSVDEDPAFRPIAVNDAMALGASRLAFLAGTIAPLAALRVAAALLLAMAPLFAGLLLFDATRAIFTGWLKALAFTALGSLGMIVAFNIELALLEPWLADTLALRRANYLTPSAPTELLAITVAFDLALLGLMALLARLVFNPAALSARLRPQAPARIERPAPPTVRETREVAVPVSRAAQVGERLTQIYRGERIASSGRQSPDSAPELVRGVSAQMSTPALSSSTAPAMIPLGRGHRRTMHRASNAGSKRDHAT